MKQITARVLICLLAVSVQAQSPVNPDKAPQKTKGWLTHFEEAKKEATAFNQPVLAFFTGSDWCSWCVKLRKEALDTQAFNTFAEGNLILFEADFPRRKTVPDAVARQNKELAATYGVRGFPTVILLDAEGKPLARTGYEKGGGEAYVRHLQALLKTAGVKPAEKPAPLSAYEKMKTKKPAEDAAEKKDVTPPGKQAP